MLVLTRRPHQSIMIGDDVVVTVLEVKGDQIRLGISAPRHVQVYREEVLEALAQANRGAVLPEAAAARVAPSGAVKAQPAAAAPRPPAATPRPAAPTPRSAA